MAQLDLEWLLVFDEVYKTANVSSAAGRLGISQSAASTALARLRTHFGDKLFNWLNTSKLCPPASTTASPPSRLQRRWPDWSVFLPCRRSMSAGLSSASWLIRSVLC